METGTTSLWKELVCNIDLTMSLDSLHSLNLMLCFLGNFAKFRLDNKYSAEAESDRSSNTINLRDNNVYFGAIVRRLSSTTSG